MCARPASVRRANDIKTYKYKKVILKFPCKENRFLRTELRRMLCNALIQPRSEYAYPARYPDLTEKTKKKIEIMQNKCIRFCLRLDKMHHVSEEHFGLINWLPTSERVNV